ncbi:unnamed protein product [Ectocarpus sp. 8 AP-2014]
MSTLQSSNQGPRGRDHRSGPHGGYPTGPRRDFLRGEPQVYRPGESVLHLPGGQLHEDEVIRKIDRVAIAVTGGLTEVKAEMKDNKTELREVKDEVEGGFGNTMAGLGEVKQEVKDGFSMISGKAG